MFKKLLFQTVCFLFCLSVNSFAQGKKGDVYAFKDIYDSVYGINHYDPLNKEIGGDSIRNDKKGYAVQGWVEDYYTDGSLLHKGYYIDGQLKAYKNFFQNGQVEREFKMTDLTRSLSVSYYPTGQKRTNIIYSGTNVIKEEDYFATGQLEYIEEYDKKGQYYLQKKSFTKDGKPTLLFELIDSKKKIYSSKEYDDNGRMEEEGQLFYNEAENDYKKNGKWKFYKENGEVKEERTYVNGEEEK